MELLKFNIQNSLQDVKNKLILLKHSRRFSYIDLVLQQMHLIQKNYTNDNLYSKMVNEIKKLNVILEIKDTQLREQLALIKVLVQKLFNVDIGLEFLEERAQSVVRWLRLGKQNSNWIYLGAAKRKILEQILETFVTLNTTQIQKKLPL